MLMGPHLRSASADPAASVEKLVWFPTDKCFIEGRWIEPQSGERLPLKDPSHGVTIGAIARGRPADVDAAERVLAGESGKLAATERGRLLAKLGALVLGRVAGGVGKSGHGREKGFEALYGFSALKTVAAWHG
jgi:acyl-CoA reductase-like NAD-dependent aldehyde dehydrogenase